MPLKTKVREQTLGKIDVALTSIFSRSYFPQFPIDPRTELGHVPRCGHMSYDQLAAINHCSHRDVVHACRSINGCTTYDPIKKRYMVYINYSTCDSLSFRRIRWTTAHEIGHIVCGHFTELIEAGAPDVSPSDVKLFDEEADYFASCLLAPLPILDFFEMKNPDDIYKHFLLSHPAAQYSMYDLKRYRAGEISYPPHAENELKSCVPTLTTRFHRVSKSDVKKLDDFLYDA